jgi:3-oxoacyl-[acyl-carrier protein] reductase
LKIRINAVAPGFIDTEWQKNKAEEIRHRIENNIALKRFGLPEEVADACIFLLNNKYVNGEIIVLDGGYGYK